MLCDKIGQHGWESSWLGPSAPSELPVAGVLGHPLDLKSEGSSRIRQIYRAKSSTALGELSRKPWRQYRWVAARPLPGFSRHAGLDPASRSRNVLKRHWIPAFAGMTQSGFLYERIQSSDKSSKIILEKFFEKHRKLKISWDIHESNWLFITCL